jgi:hypothetical protein
MFPNLYIKQKLVFRTHFIATEISHNLYQTTNPSHLDNTQSHHLINFISFPFGFIYIYIPRNIVYTFFTWKPIRCYSHLYDPFILAASTSSEFIYFSPFQFQY